MNIRFLTLAQQELDEAVIWYDDQAPNLGLKFLTEVHKAIKRIAAYPQSCKEVEVGIRRCLVNRFPYGLIYGVDKDSIVIIAVAHLHRKPRYWYERV